MTTITPAEALSFMKQTKNNQAASNAHEDRFFSLVYELVRLIPYGRVSSYGAIAAAIGSPGAARMVGWALNHCSLESETVPAHRVVNRNGVLSGKHSFKEENTMQQLLEREGIIIKDDKVVDFKRLFWDPLIELSDFG